jgi:hypothetical protein
MGGNYRMTRNGELAPWEPESPEEALLVGRASVLGIQFMHKLNYGYMAYNSVERQVYVGEEHLTPPEYSGAARIYGLAHELGHAVSQAKPDYALRVMQALTRVETPFAFLARDEDFKLLYREEVMAWRIGVRILRRLGIRIIYPILRTARDRSLRSYKRGLLRDPWRVRYARHRARTVADRIESELFYGKGY